MSEAIMDCQKMKIFRFNKQINNQMQFARPAKNRLRHVTTP